MYRIFKPSIVKEGDGQNNNNNNYYVEMNNNDQASPIIKANNNNNSSKPPRSSSPHKIKATTTTNNKNISISQQQQQPTTPTTTINKKISDIFHDGDNNNNSTRTTLKSTVFLGWTFWPFKSFKKVWVLGFNAKNVIVFIYVNLKTGRRRVLINGLEYIDTIQTHSNAWTYETTFPDERFPHDIHLALHIRIEQFARTATLTVDGIDVRYLKRSSSLLVGSPVPIPPPPVQQQQQHSHHHIQQNIEIISVYQPKSSSNHGDSPPSLPPTGNLNVSALNGVLDISLI
jgi:hypothetical protein